jgi:probable HAF family extracellular repeat protein
VVGRITTALDQNRAFFWADGVMSALPSLEGGAFTAAEAINPAGQVVGQASTAHNQLHATLWTRR